MEFVELVVIARKLYRIKKENDENKYEDEFFELLFEQLDNKVLYVDSNIFMTDSNEGVNRFFNEISKYKNIKITMPREQYEEIYNLKNSDVELKSKSGRHAFRVIEKLFDSKHLDILELDDEVNKSQAYADPVFINMITEDLKNDKQVYFITEDKDLKIRLKSKIKTEKLNEDNMIICSFDTLYQDKYNIVEEDRTRKKKSAEEDRFIEELASGESLKDKALDKVASFLTK